MNLQTLQVGRNLLNESELVSWSVGFLGAKAIDSELHTTIAYSHELVDISNPLFAPVRDTLTVSGGRRDIKKFRSGHLVLVFESARLRDRWTALKENGASWDYPEFIPHVTIGKDVDVDIVGLKPFRGDLEFGPEYLKTTKSK